MPGFSLRRERSPHAVWCRTERRLVIGAPDDFKAIELAALEHLILRKYQRLSLLRWRYSQRCNTTAICRGGVPSEPSFVLQSYAGSGTIVATIDASSASYSASPIAS